MKIYLSIFICHCIIGIIVLILDRKRIKETHKPVNGSPFYQGFMFGLYQASIIIMYPFHLLMR